MSKVIFDQISLVVDVSEHAVHTLFPDFRFIVYQNYVFVLEIINMWAHIDREFPYMIIGPLHLWCEVFPVAKLYNTADDTELLSWFANVFYIEV